MERFPSAADATNAIAEHIRKLYKPYAGAQFRLAFFREASVRLFLTGHVIFSEEPLRSRDAADYGRLLFVEHWCHEQGAAVGLLSKLLSGQAEIEGQKIDVAFSTSELDHRTHPTGPELWTGWQLRSTQVRDAAWREIYLPQGRLTGRGLNPYLGPDHAINDWIFGLESFNPVSADIPNRHTIVTTLPDSRARILSAVWRPPNLHLHVERNVPPDLLELQILPVDSRAKFQTVPLDASEIDIAVPEDARSISIFLLDHSGDCISEVALNEHQRIFGKANPQSGRPIYGVTMADEIEFSVGANVVDGYGASVFESTNGSDERRFMQMAIEEARKSVAEDELPRPKVGAVVVKDGQVLAKAHRGEIPGCHAEYIALEKKLADHKLSGATVYTTLEPCTSRSTPKIACATRLIERRVARVVIGTPDPNPVVRGLGHRSLIKARIDVGVFDPDLVQEIEELNREFTRQYEGRAAAEMPSQETGADDPSSTPGLKDEVGGEATNLVLDDSDLRNSLMTQFRNIELRKQYLTGRSRGQERMDRKRATVTRQAFGALLAIPIASCGLLLEMHSKPWQVWLGFAAGSWAISTCALFAGNGIGVAVGRAIYLGFFFGFLELVPSLLSPWMPRLAAVLWACLSLGGIIAIQQTLSDEKGGAIGPLPRLGYLLTDSFARKIYLDGNGRFPISAFLIWAALVLGLWYKGPALLKLIF